MEQSPQRTTQPEWELLVRFLPDGWREQAELLGAFRRARRIESPEALLRLILMHGGSGLSLQRSAEAAAASGLGELSKVAVWKRMQKVGPWLEWMVQALLRARVSDPAAKGLRPRAVDGSAITGPKRRVQLRLHYALDLRACRVDQVEITDEHTAEDLQHFRVTAGELLVADRGYARGAGIAGVKQNGGEVLVRIGCTSLVLYDDQGAAIDRLKWLRSLGGYEPGERGAQFRDEDGHWITGRLCAIRLSPAQADQARERRRQSAQRQGYSLGHKSEEAAGYLCLFTTAPASALSCSQALELYRARWQIELSFKYLKSLLDADQLRDTSPLSARNWLLTKMLYALLLYAYLDEAGAFSPWGYPLLPGTVPVAGTVPGAHPLLCLGADPTGPPSPRRRHHRPSPLHPPRVAPDPPAPRRRTPTTQATPPSREAARPLCRHGIEIS
jgi:hypothetical protein